MKQIRTFFLGENLVMFDLQDVVKVEVNDTLATFTLNNGESLNTDKFDLSLLNSIKTVYLSAHSTYVNVKSIVGYSDAELVDVLGNKYVITEDESKQIGVTVADAETIIFLNYTFIKENVITLNGTQKKVNGVSIDLHKPVGPTTTNYLSIKPLNGYVNITNHLSNGYLYECSNDEGETWIPFVGRVYLPQTENGILIRGNGCVGPTSGSYGIFIEGSAKISGSIMSLIDGTGETTVIPEGQNFKSLFNSSTATIDASELELPATTLTDSCYNAMFFNCEKLLAAPKVLPATTLTPNCYTNMFRWCRALVTAPIIMAEDMSANGCMTMMLNDTKIKKVEIHVDSWYTDNAMSWLSSVPSDGKLLIKQGLEIPQGSSGCPDSWEIEYI